MLLRLIKWAFRTGALVLVLTIVAVLYYSHVNLQRYGGGPAEPVNAVIVLGGGIDPDGIPSFSTRRRVLGGVRLLEAGKTRYLILSGGPSSHPPGSRAAELMQAHALDLGADAVRLITEPDSATTFQNLRFSFAVAEAQGFKRLAILSDSYHVERARHLAAFFGRPDVEIAAIDGLHLEQRPLRIWAILREALAWWYNLGKVLAWEALGMAGVDESSRAVIIE